MNEVKAKKCIICGKFFLYRTKPGRRNSKGSKRIYRGRNSIACSKNCSKIYSRSIYKFRKQKEAEESGKVKNEKKKKK